MGVKLILFRQSASLWSLLGFGATSLIYIVCYASLAGMAGVDLTPCTNISLCLFSGDENQQERLYRASLPQDQWVQINGMVHRDCYSSQAHVMLLSPLTAWALGALLGNKSACLMNSLLLHAEPIYDASGQLVDGGADLSMGGMCSYYHDLIYLAAIVQVASIFTDRSWWSFLLVSSPSVRPLSGIGAALPRMHAQCSWLSCHGSCLQRSEEPFAMQVPAYGLYQLWVNVLQPYLFTPRPKVACAYALK